MGITIRYSVALLLTLSILLGSVGVALSEQLCQMTGMRQAASAPTAADCCKTPTTPTSKDDCCEEHVAYHKLEPVSSLKQYNLQLPAFALPVPGPQLPLQVAAASVQEHIYTCTDGSPPLHGRQLLLHISTLIV